MKQGGIMEGFTGPILIRRVGEKGTWFADCSYKGIRLRDNLKTSDFWKARGQLEYLKALIDKGEYKKHKQFFCKLSKQYLNLTSERSVQCKERIESIIRIHLDPFFGTMRLQQIDKEEEIKYKLFREKVGAKESTLKKELRVLKNIILMVDPYWKNPTSHDSDLMKFQNKGKKINGFLEEAQVYEILKYVPEKYKRICLIAAYSGLRLKDVVELIWGDIDLVENWVVVNQSKTGHKVSIPICNKLKEVIESIEFRSANDEGRLFHGISRKAVTAMFKRACKKAGYDGFGFHSLRHFFGSFLANSGKPHELIAKVLGHQDLRSTEIYVHYKPETLKHVVEPFDSIGLKNNCS